MTVMNTKGVAERWNRMFEKFRTPSGITKVEEDEYKQAFSAEKSQREDTSNQIIGGQMDSPYPGQPLPPRR